MLDHLTICHLCRERNLIIMLHSKTLSGDDAIAPIETMAKQKTNQLLDLRRHKPKEILDRFFFLL